MNLYSKYQMNRIIISHKNLLSKWLKNQCFKWTYGQSGNDYRVATLSNMAILRKRANRSVSDGP